MRSDKLVLTTSALSGSRSASHEHDINYDVILSPVITEKATKLTETNQVVFASTLDATKPADRQGGRRPLQGEGEGGEHRDREGQEEGVRGQPSSGAITRKRS